MGELAGTLTAINAGCISPYIKYQDGQVKDLDIGGFVLGQGLGSEFGYQSVTRNLVKGDLVILTSDGVVEVTNQQRDLFSFDRLETALLNGPNPMLKPC